MKIRNVYADEVINNVDCFISSESDTIESDSMTIKEIFDLYVHNTEALLSSPLQTRPYDFDGDADKVGFDDYVPEYDSIDTFEVSADLKDRYKKKKDVSPDVVPSVTAPEEPQPEATN